MGRSHLEKRVRIALVAIVAVLLLVSIVRFLPSSGPASTGGKSFVFSIAGDFGSWNGFDETLGQLRQSNSDFALALGDLSYGGESEASWCDEFRESSVNPIVVAGNHDTGAAPPGEGNINNFTAACPFRLNATAVGEYGKQYYFDYPGTNPFARFVLISPDLFFAVDSGEHYVYDVGTPRYDWTTAVIDGARTAGIPWVFVGMHKNCIAGGEHECETGTDILNLLLDKKVDLILNAHTHNYERSKQLALNPTTCLGIELHVFNENCIVDAGSNGRYTRGDGPVVVIAGTGGRDIDLFNVSDSYARYFAAWAGNETPGFGKGVATFTVDANHVSMVTHFNGTYSDAFTISGSAAGLSSNFFQVLPLAAPGLGVIGLGVGGVLAYRRRGEAEGPSEW